MLNRIMRAARLCWLAVLLAVVSQAADDYSGLESDHFKFGADAVNGYLEDNAFKDPKSMTACERFRYNYYMRDWPAVAAGFKSMNPYKSRAVYERMLSDITRSGRPVMNVDDYIGLLRACPVKPDETWVKHLGEIGRAVVLPEEHSRLAAALRSGMPFFGGKDESARINAGLAMMHAHFKDIASEFLPKTLDLSKIESERERQNVVRFRNALGKKSGSASQLLLENWNNYRERLLNKLPEKDVKAFHELGQMIGNGVPVDLVVQLIADINAKSPELAGSFAMLIVKKIGDDQLQSDDKGLRLSNLELAVALIPGLSKHIPLKQGSWRVFADAMATVWLAEAKRTICDQERYEKRYHNGRWGRYVAADDLLRVVPSGIWLDALSDRVAVHIGYFIPKLTMYSSSPDSTVDTIIKLAEKDPDAAAVIAGEYLNRWAALHDPVVPNAVVRSNRLKSGASIIVTPMMTSKNVDDLAKMVSMLSSHGIELGDSRKIMRAFQKCYGSSEIYRREHITKVFGAPEEMNADLFTELILSMAESLGKNWRKSAEQKNEYNPTHRNNPLPVVRRAYADTISLIDAWASKHPAGWEPLTMAGVVLDDWADFELFQQMGPVPMQERLKVYNEKNILAHDFFRRGAEAYARAVPEISPAHFSAQAYISWFDSLMGLNMSGEINLSKQINRSALEEIRAQIYALPSDYIESHINLFSKHIKDVQGNKHDPLPPELRYRYAFGALMIVKSTPFGAELDHQQDYFDQLLSEVRLSTRIDGPSKVCRKSEFGLVISLVHTAALGDQINFEKYVTPQPAFKNRGHLKKMPVSKKLRNEFESMIYERLAPFFEVKSVTFSSKDVRPRELDKDGWQETVLAYVLLRPKGISVDRIPALNLKLKFIDKDGPVELPVFSPETMLEVVDKDCRPRPYGNMEVTQTLDSRRLYKDGILEFRVKVVGEGIMPELDRIMNLEPLKKCLKIKHISSPDGSVIKKVYSWSEDVRVVSERQWRLVLDSAPVVSDPEEPFEFSYPLRVSTNTVVKNMVYADVDPVEVGDNVIQLLKKDESGAAEVESGALAKRAGSWGVAFVVLLLVVGFQVWQVWRRRPTGPASNAGLVLPDEYDAFTVVGLLRRQAALVAEDQREQLFADIASIERRAFDPDGDGVPPDELRYIAARWLG